MNSTSEPLTNSAKNIQKFSDALAANADGIKNFTSAMADIGKAVGPLSTKLSKLSDDTDNVVKAVDPNQVKSIVADITSLSSKLNAAANKVDGVLTNLNGFLATKDSKGAFGEVADAAKSIHKLADDLDVSTKELMANLNHFSTTGLRQYEALAIDGRKTLSRNQSAPCIRSKTIRSSSFSEKKSRSRKLAAVAEARSRFTADRRPFFRAAPRQRKSAPVHLLLERPPHLQR